MKNERKTNFGHGLLNVFFSGDELHIILERNLEMCEHSSFIIVDEIVF